MMAAAARPASGDFPPVSHTTAVRGGLALTGNAPISPASTLPTPTPVKSRSTSGGWSALGGKDRVVAAVCTMTTMAMMRLSETRLVRWSAVIIGSLMAGTEAWIAPRA